MLNYELQPFNYDYRSNDDKLSLHGNLEAFYWNIHADTHALVVPEYQSLEEHRQAMEERLCDGLREAGKRHIQTAHRPFTRQRHPSTPLFHRGRS